ncbi:putative ABC transporter ATP-binding protein YxlF [mine drainage metagenome]|uniref:Putative ABC transporter ATP-binding protein YxlF n=1 Tax=mine drainage metagenome TaxID=410659 RepID=A0A1J5RF26_9ZZZZ
MVAIQVDALCFGYRALRLFDRCEFGLEFGTVYGLVAPNGAGKSSLLQLLADRRRPDSGDIRRFVPVRQLGLLGQDEAAFGMLTVGECVELFGMVNRGAGPAGWRELLRTMDPPAAERAQGLAERRCASLSAGERRWLHLECMLSLPRLRGLLLDEPTVGVDPGYRLLMAQRIRSWMSRQQGVVVIASHMLDDLRGLCDVILLIRNRGIEPHTGLQAFVDAYGAANADAAFAAAFGSCPDRILASSH